MSKIDLLLKNAKIVTEDDTAMGNIIIADGKILDISSSMPDAIETIDCTGLTAMPGGVDAHSHIWEPTSFEYREDFYTGTCAAAAGGITTIIEMPLSEPPVEDLSSFDNRKKIACEKSIIDFALWGAFTENSLEHLKALNTAGCVAFKAFLSYANPNYDNVDDYILLKGMNILAKAGAVIGVHAENEAITRRLSREMRNAGIFRGSAHEEARPELSELEAIERVITLAEGTGCNLHICHIATAKAVTLIRQAISKGISITAETCPHYLTLTVEDLDRVYGHAKCNPPLRSKENKEKLWDMVRYGDFDIIGTDHTPYTVHDREKYGEDIWSMPAGIGGNQLFLPLLIDEGHNKRNIDLSTIAKITSSNPAKRMGIYEKKGALKPGFDADIVLIDTNKEWTFRAEDAFMKAKCTKGPYENRKIKGKILNTIVRGRQVMKDGKILVNAGYGRFVAKLGRGGEE